MAAEEGFADVEVDAIAALLKEAWVDGGTWRAVAIAAVRVRDAREKVIVDRVEHFLEKLIEDTGVENPSLTVKDVRDRLFSEVPQ